VGILDVILSSRKDYIYEGSRKTPKDKGKRDRNNMTIQQII
jgi:hypothetical protein